MGTVLAATRKDPFFGRGDAATKAKMALITSTKDTLAPDADNVMYEDSDGLSTLRALEFTSR